MANAPTYTLLGLDPGLAETGFAIASVEGRSPKIDAVLAIGLISAERDDADMPVSDDRFRRSGWLNTRLQWVVDEFGVDAVMCEQAFFKTRYPNYASGLVMGAIAALNLPTTLVWPQRSKKAATGNGRASKRDMIAWAMKQTRPDRIPWPTSVVPNGLRLKFEGRQVAAYAEHLADALAAIQAGIEEEEWLTAPDRD